MVGEAGSSGVEEGERTGGVVVLDLERVVVAERFASGGEGLVSRHGRESTNCVFSGILIIFV